MIEKYWRIERHDNAEKEGKVKMGTGLSNPRSEPDDLLSPSALLVGEPFQSLCDVFLQLSPDRISADALWDKRK